MWFLLFLLFFQSSPMPCQSTTPAQTRSPWLIVQVVDPDYFPIPGASVILKALNGKTQSNPARTEESGYAKFFGLADLDYSIEAKVSGLKHGRVKLSHFGNP